MMRAEASRDVGDLFALGVVDREMPSRAFKREELGRRMVRTLAAEIEVSRRAHRGCDPNTPKFVEHRIVDVVLAVPNRFVAPVGRRLRHIP